MVSGAILFHDRITTAHAAPGFSFRRTVENDAAALPDDLKGVEWVIEGEGRIAGGGGVLFHYNRPYGDVYMNVLEPFRRRGLGAFLVQELKRACYEGGSLPGARCNTTNLASRKTLQKAGFVPCGHILVGRLAP